MKVVPVLNRGALLRPLTASAVVFSLVLSACGGAKIESTPTPVGGDVDSGVSSGASIATTTAASTVAAGDGADVVYAFPTGPAVTVPEGYVAPGNHVPATGAYLPTNGKPTLVFVDAIW